MPEHKYAAILRAIADGKKIQVLDGCGQWWDASAARVLDEIFRQKMAPDQFRTKPEIVIINGIEVPAPERDEPGLESIYYAPAVSQYYVDVFVKLRWSRDQYDLAFLRRGLVHLTREAAEAHARALLSFTEQPCQN